MKHDVLIVGAGMVGATCAALLADSGLRILLVDAAAAPEPSPLRVSALGRASARILDAAGAWDALAEVRSPYRAMTVWDHANTGSVHFDAEDAGLEALGWIVPNQAVQHALLARLARCERVEVALGQAVEALEVADTGVQVRLGDRRVRCALVIGADGARSQVRALADIAVDQADYGQLGVVATVATQDPHEATAWQRFLAGGPVALLPLLDGRCSVVWSLPNAQAEATLALDDAAFCAALTEATEARLGHITGTSTRAGFPLSRLHARDYVKPHIALVGDAAHVVHPLAGQGANLGLLDAAALAQVLGEEAAAGRAPGAWRALRRYARWRRAHNTLVQQSLDAFHHGFTSARPWVREARGLGLAMADALGPLKRVLVEFATGERGDLPAIAMLNRSGRMSSPRR